jgi:hypothetical protein
MNTTPTKSSIFVHLLENEKYAAGFTIDGQVFQILNGEGKPCEYKTIQLAQEAADYWLEIETKKDYERPGLIDSEKVKKWASKTPQGPIKRGAGKRTPKPIPPK